MKKRLLGDVCAAERGFLLLLQRLRDHLGFSIIGRMVTFDMGIDENRSYKSLEANWARHHIAVLLQSCLSALKTDALLKTWLRNIPGSEVRAARGITGRGWLAGLCSMDFSISSPVAAAKGAATYCI